MTQPIAIISSIGVVASVADSSWVLSEFEGRTGDWLTRSAGKGGTGRADRGTSVTGAGAVDVTLDAGGSVVVVDANATVVGGLVLLADSLNVVATVGWIAVGTVVSADGGRPPTAAQAVRTMVAETQAATRYTSM